MFRKIFKKKMECRLRRETIYLYFLGFEMEVWDTVLQGFLVDRVHGVLLHLCLLLGVVIPPVPTEGGLHEVTLEVGAG